MEWRTEPKPPNDLSSQGQLLLLGKEQEEKLLREEVDEHPYGSVLAAGALFV